MERKMEIIGIIVICRSLSSCSFHAHYPTPLFHRAAVFSRLLNVALRAPLEPNDVAGNVRR